MNFTNLITESSAKIILVILGQDLNPSPCQDLVSYILEKETIVFPSFKKIVKERRLTNFHQ